MAKIILALLAIMLTSACETLAQSSFGKFEGVVRTEWFRGVEKERRMQLLEDFAYIDSKGQRWVAPKGSITDGASIPQALWSFIGGPFEGAWREAAVIHDRFCDTKTAPWQDVHRIFYYGNRAAGVSEFQSKLLYAGVMIGGPKWGSGPSKCYAGCHAAVETKIDSKGREFSQASLTDADVKQLAEWLRVENPTIEQIDSRIAKQFPASSVGHGKTGNTKK